MAHTSTFDFSPGSARQADDRLIELLSYWTRRRGDHQMPRRAEIDPVDIPRLLPHLMLTDVVDTSRYRYRLVGTAIEDVAGVGMTGRYVEDVIGHVPYRDYLIDLYAEVTRRRCPVFSESDFIATENEPVRATQRIMLPLSTDGEEVDVVLSGQVFIDRDSESPLPEPEGPFRGRVTLLLPGK